MPRVKRGVTARARHKKVLALAKGFRGRRGGGEGRASALRKSGGFRLATKVESFDSPQKWLGAIKARKFFATPHEHNEEGAFTCPR